MQGEHRARVVALRLGVDAPGRPAAATARPSVKPRRPGAPLHRRARRVAAEPSPAHRSHGSCTRSGGISHVGHPELVAVVERRRPAQREQQHRRDARLGRARAATRRASGRGCRAPSSATRRRAAPPRSVSISEASARGFHGRREQVHVRRHVHPGGVVAHEPLDRQVQLADHHPAALGDRLCHRDHRSEVAVVGAADGQQRVVLGQAGPVVRVRRVVAPLRVLEHLAQRVDAEAVDAAVEPEAQDAEHRLAQLRVAPVEVGLLAQIGVVVEAPALGIERPRRAAEHAQPVVGRPVAPQVPVGVLAKPRVLVRRVVRDVVEQQPQIARRARRPPARRSPPACRTAARSRMWSEMS